MTPPSSPSRSHHTTPLPFFDSINRSFESLTTTVFSRLPFVPLKPNPIPSISNPSSIGPPLSSPVTVPFLLPPLSFPSHYRTQSQGQASPSSAIRSFSSNVRIDGLSSKGGGPAFVGQVFSMLDPSGNGLMAVTTHFDIPFISKRTPNWIKKMLAMVTKSEQNDPIFRFFMDLSDAVEYVKRLNVPTGMVGACRLDVAYEHFKEKPHMFQFVPNKKQVKAANELLKRIPLKHGRRKLVGVPVFTAQNLNIAIATNDGIKWYTPYFFDKNLLDNILEASFDQHFHALIQNRHTQRRRDVIDDSLTAEVIEENGDGLFDPPEVREVLDEIGHQDIPLSVISKAAEIKLLDVVDKMLLGNKWMRKASGIQPKFPYLVDSFEERSASAFVKDAARASSASGAEVAGNDRSELQQLGASELDLNDYVHGGRGQPKRHAGFQFPFGRWFANPRKSEKTKSDMRTSDMDGDGMERPPANPLLPKITMVGISMGEGGQVNRANLKKTMEDLTEELKESQKASKLDEDKDPLFVANVGDYSSITRMDAS